jgi:hypothetical protein
MPEPIPIAALPGSVCSEVYADGWAHRIAPATPFQCAGCAIKLDALPDGVRELADDGDLPSGWVKWWLDLADFLVLERPSWNASLVEFLVPRWLRPSPLYRIEPLRITGLCAALTAWKFERSGAIVWGATPDAFNRPAFPIRCQGAIIPFCDGAAALFAVGERDLEELQPWWAGNCPVR